MPEYFTDKEWFTLPLSLRSRWWKETNYSKIPPSEELLAEIKECLEKGKKDV